MNQTWATVVALGCCLVLLAGVAVERNRVKRRLDAAEGAITGLRLDLAAARDEVARLHVQLSDETDARTAPTDTRAPTVPDRWSAPPGHAQFASDDVHRPPLTTER